jgi:hypothetical protein
MTTSVERSSGMTGHWWLGDRKETSGMNPRLVRAVREGSDKLELSRKERRSPRCPVLEMEVSGSSRVSGSCKLASV